MFGQKSLDYSRGPRFCLAKFSQIQNFTSLNMTQNSSSGAKEAQENQFDVTNTILHENIILKKKKSHRIYSKNVEMFCDFENSKLIMWPYNSIGRKVGLVYNFDMTCAALCFLF